MSRTLQRSKRLIECRLKGAVNLEQRQLNPGWRISGCRQGLARGACEDAGAGRRLKHSYHPAKTACNQTARCDPCDSNWCHELAQVFLRSFSGGAGDTASETIGDLYWEHIYILAGYRADVFGRSESGAAVRCDSRGVPLIRIESLRVLFPAPWGGVLYF